MYGTLKKLFNLLFFPVYEKRVIIIGLDHAGKTTLLYMLKNGECVNTIPTIGFNVETIEYKNISFTMWDLGGRSKSRPLWRHYMQNTSAVILIVDSSDHDRMVDGNGYERTAEDDLRFTLNEQGVFDDAPFLILANKQDLPNALSGKEVAKRIGVDDQLKGRKWKVFECVATTGEGLYEGLDWLSDVLNGKEDADARSGVLSSKHKYSEAEKEQLLIENHESIEISNTAGGYLNFFFC